MVADNAWIVGSFDSAERNAVREAIAAAGILSFEPNILWGH
jgi:hypothetical protein